ncbi:MAG: SMC-Scp complex subunit ScpB, partial [Oscillospiraceae bacterium]|nr:SMC-Scp complex subunit ScpB [Oscillospiraceae bacterium]
MNAKMYKSAVEAVLFAVGEPISAEKIASSIGIERSAVNMILDELAAEYDDRERGVCLLRYEDRWQLAARPAFSEFVTRALD